MVRKVFRRTSADAFAPRGALFAALFFASALAHAQIHAAPPAHTPPGHEAPGVAAPVQGHEGHVMGGHGEVAPESKHFSTIAYDDARGPRPVQKRQPLPAGGDPVLGKRLAHDEAKGRCLSCHIMDRDGALPGDVGPDLSTYGTQGRDPSYTFQQIWDSRAHNPATVMPPFGTNGLLSETEVAHIVAYLHTLRESVRVAARPAPREERERVHVAGVDFSSADEYIDAGRSAFAEAGANGRSCASCHARHAERPVDLGAAASRYPRYVEARGRVVGLEEQVNACREGRMASTPLPLGSRAMNLLAGYVKFLGRESKIAVETGGPGAAAIERGRASFQRKAGQLNFSCADCHTTHADRWLRGQRLQRLDRTAGEWPKQFIAVHDLGYISLRFRIQHCQIVTRTAPLPLHAQEYVELEYYLTSLANGSAVLAPTKTRLRGE
jgi:sulfur-oxidizing protein SoxA